MLRKSEGNLYNWRTVYNGINEWVPVDSSFVLYKAPQVTTFDIYNDKIMVFGSDSGRLFFTYDGFQTIDSIKREDIKTLQVIKILNDSIVINPAFDRTVFYNLKNKTYYFEEFTFEGIQDDDSSFMERCIFHLKDGILFRAVNIPNKGYDIIVKSNDYGHSWKMLNPFYREHITDMFFFDELHGFVTGREKIASDGRKLGYIYETTDGGQNWIKRYDEGDVLAYYGFTYIKFIDSLNGIAFGNPNAWLRTTDGGKNWWIDTTFKTLDYGIFQTISYIRNDLVIAANTDNEIYKIDLTKPNSVEMIYEPEELVIMPNPSKDGLFNIKLYLNRATDVVFIVTDIYGNELSSFSKFIGAGEQLINFDGGKILSSGVYFVRSYFNNKIHYSKLLVQS